MICHILHDLIWLIQDILYWRLFYACVLLKNKHYAFCSRLVQLIACDGIWFNLFCDIVIPNHFPDSKAHGVNMGPIWVLSAPVGPNVDPMNFDIRVANWLIPSWFIHPLLYRPRSPFFRKSAHDRASSARISTCLYIHPSHSLWRELVASWN